MAANSLFRRLAKRALHPILGQRQYGALQGIAKAWDIRSGAWTEPEVALIPRVVRPGETALDVGANYGLYAYHLSRAAGSRGKVYAFEPIPFTAAALALVARLLRLGNVEIVRKGCSDRPGFVTFTVPIQESGAISAAMSYAGSRTPSEVGTSRRYQTVATIECEVVRVDDVVPAHVEVSFLKCDIEGAELLALRGAAATIERTHPTVVCEIHPRFLQELGIDLLDLVGFFTERGYRMYRYEAGRTARDRLVPIEARQVTGENYVFVHPARADRFESLTGSG